MNSKEKRQAAWTTAAAIMALAWPTIAEQVMQTAVQYIDTAMVGFLALISKACGAGDLESAKKAAAQTCLVVLTAGSIATVACTAVNGINIVLNFLLIYDTRTVSLLGLILIPNKKCKVGRSVV